MANYISEVQIVPIKPNNGLVAFASMVFNNSFYIGSIGVFTKPEGGYRLTYPIRNSQKGKINIVHPINHEIGQMVLDAVISKYEEVINK